MATLDGFPASFYGEPGVLGMLSNGISAFLVLLQNFNTARTGVPPQGVENILAGTLINPSIHHDHCLTLLSVLAVVFQLVVQHQ